MFSSDNPTKVVLFGLLATYDMQFIMKKTSTEFKAFFHRQIRPRIGLLEHRRKRIVSRRFLIGILILIIILLVYVAIYVANYVNAENPNTTFFLSSIVIIVIGVIIGSFYSEDKKFRKDFKKGYIEPIVKFVNPNLNYYPDEFIGEEIFNYSRLFRHYPNRYEASDLIEGHIGNAKVKFSEVNAVYVLNPNATKKDERKQKIFSGLFFVADFGTNIQKTTLIVPRSDLQDVFSKSPHRERTELLVEVNYPEFSEHFTVYAEDKDEANLLLTKNFLQRILTLRKNHLGRVSISFVESCLYIAISMTDRLLEPQMLRKITRFENAKIYFNQVQYAATLLHKLNPAG